VRSVGRGEHEAEHRAAFDPEQHRALGACRVHDGADVVHLGLDRGEDPDHDRSDVPLPRRSNRRTRACDASPRTNDAYCGRSHDASMFE
jgi:hypothetical protein